MEHHNPITGITEGLKFITFGEIMLRLTPPNYGKIRVANSFEAGYGGSEANIALALANLGVDSTFFSVVPNNSLGKSAIRMLRSNDVHCTPVVLSTPEETPTHRLGTYYLETGYGVRPSKVTYDRKNSAITEYDFSKIDVDALLEGFDWLHFSGITPALSKGCAEFVLKLMRSAKEKGLTVSFSFAIGRHNNNPLVFETFDLAIQKYPDAHPLFHSDRGFQYTSKLFKAKLDKQGMQQSMSRVGRCIDNGPMEGFWGILKCEMYYLNHFETYEELVAAVEQFVHYYNHQRRQHKLNCLPPATYRSLLEAA